MPSVVNIIITILYTASNGYRGRQGYFVYYKIKFLTSCGLRHIVGYKRNPRVKGPSVITRGFLVRCKSGWLVQLRSSNLGYDYPYAPEHVKRAVCTLLAYLARIKSYLKHHEAFSTMNFELCWLHSILLHVYGHWRMAE
jgi:hypothetical protein